MFKTKRVLPRSGRRCALAALTIAGCLAPLGLAPAPASAGVTVDEARGSGAIVEATFNRPAVGAEDTHVTDHLRTLIESAEPGATIKIAMHSITGRGIKDAIVGEAPGNDGSGQVIVLFDRTKIDQSADPASTVTMAEELRRDLEAAGGEFVECGHNASSTNDGGCLSGTETYSRQHAKYVLISHGWKRSGSLSNPGFFWGIVWIGSANVSGNGGWETYNNAITSYGDTDLYLALEKTFDKARPNNWPSADFYDNPVGTGYSHGPKSNITTWASPEATTGNDLVVQRLKDITPSGDGTCQIRVMQTAFTDRRGADVANQLVALRNGGCWTWVLVDEANGVATMDDEVRSVLCGKVAIRKQPNIHDKAIVIRANYNGSFKSIVLTGSHNITPEALRNNDEILARVGASSGPLYNAYVNHFGSAWGNAENVTCP